MPFVTYGEGKGPIAGMYRFLATFQGPGCSKSSLRELGNWERIIVGMSSVLPISLSFVESEVSPQHPMQMVKVLIEAAGFYWLYVYMIIVVIDQQAGLI